MLYLGTVRMFLLVVIGPVSGYECSHGHAMPKLETPMPSYLASSVLQAAKDLHHTEDPLSGSALLC